MPSTPPPIEPSPDEDDELQFTTVEPVDAAGATGGASVAAASSCVACKRPIVSEYYAIGDKVLCPMCTAQLQAPPAGTRVGRLGRATLYGLIAGLLGALIWFAIRKITHLEIGLVAVLVGFMVGTAVRKGSGGRGGRRYQVLAVVLTYSCIAANYMPDVLAAFIDIAHKDQAATAPTTGPTTSTATVSSGASATQPATASSPKKHSIGMMLLAVLLLVALVFVTSLAAPFLAGAANIIGLLIIGFALWEAWKLNRRRVLPISGPYQFTGGGGRALRRSRNSRARWRHRRSLRARSAARSWAR